MWKTAPPKVACPDGQDGKGGFKEMRLLFVSGAPYERKKGSANGFSVSRIPVSGRQYS